MPLYRYYFFKIYILLWCCYELQVEAEAPSFLVPIASTAPRSVNENSPKDLSILTVEGQDGDGDTLTFSISTQSPMSPPFELDSATGLFKTPNGLDAETTRSFVFTFGVSDGTTTVDSVQFTVNINDLNDNTPQFVGAPYSASLLDSVGDGTSVVNVTATDADITPTTISYSIAGGNTGTTFAIDTGNGQITVASSGNLNGAATYTLTVQASDGAKAGNATVTVAVRVDFCATSPCQNGGSCTNGATTHTCTCASGYTGTNCTEIEDDQDCDCCICPWLIPVVLGVVILITVGIFLYCMDKNDKLDGVPLIGNCFKKKKSTPVTESELSTHRKGYESDSAMLDTNETSPEKSMSHQGGNFRDKLKPPENSEASDYLNATDAARADGVNSEKADKKSPK